MQFVQLHVHVGRLDLLANYTVIIYTKTTPFSYSHTHTHPWIHHYNHRTASSILTLQFVSEQVPVGSWQAAEDQLTFELHSVL